MQVLFSIWRKIKTHTPVKHNKVKNNKMSPPVLDVGDDLFSERLEEQPKGGVSISICGSDQVALRR